MEFLLLLLVVPFLIGDLFGGDDAHDSDGPDINGTENNDTLEGTDQDEEINAGAGDDGILAHAGDDTVKAEDGRDVVLGEGGDDSIFGGAGNDYVDGGSGDDTIWLGDGDDVIAPRSLSELTDLDTGAAGDDQISGGDGNDVMGDWLGSDTLTGELGRDLVFTLDRSGTEDAPDVSSGGWGIDTLFADDGDTMSGGENPDEFHVLVDEEGDSAVTITDFDSANETIELDLTADTFANAGPDDLQIETDPQTGDVTISVAGQVIALVIDPGSFDASNVVVPLWGAAA